MYKKLLYGIMILSCILALISYTELAEDVPTAIAPVSATQISATPTPAAPVQTPAVTEAPPAAAQHITPTTTNPTQPVETTPPQKTSQTFAESLGVQNTEPQTSLNQGFGGQAQVVIPATVTKTETIPVAPPETGVPTCAVLCDKVCSILKEETEKEIETPTTK